MSRNLSRQRDIHSRILRAITQGNHTEVIDLISKHGLSYLPHWSHGYSLLLLAVENDQSFIAWSLLKRGAKVNSKNNFVKHTPSPLHVAVEHENERTVYDLLQKGADANVTNHVGETPLSLAYSLENSEIFHVFVETGICSFDKSTLCASYSPLLVATVYKLENVVQRLLNSGANVNDKSLRGRSALHIAVVGKYLTLCKLFVRKGAAINSKDVTGNTPLHIAAKMKDTEVFVEILLKNGASVNEKNNLGKNALHIAVEIGNLKSVKLLLTYGASVNEFSGSGATPLKIAVQKWYLEIAQVLISHGAIAMFKVRKESYSPLTGEYVLRLLRSNTPRWQVPEEGAPKLVKDVSELDQELEDVYLNICKGLPTCEPDGGVSNQAVSNAVIYNVYMSRQNDGVAKLLIANSASVKGGQNKFPACYDAHLTSTMLDNNYKYSQESTIVELALPVGIHYARENVVKIFFKNFKNYKVIETLPRMNDFTKTIDICLAEVMDLLSAPVGKCPLKNILDLISPGPQYVLIYVLTLHAAVRTGSDKLAEILLQHNFDANEKNEEGETPLHVCAKLGIADLVAILLNAGADINIPTREGNTALYIAADSCREEVTDLLLNAGADVNIATVDGKTALHVAAEFDNKQIVLLLLKKGGDLNARTIYGYTPLHFAASTDVVRMIIDSGGYIDSKCCIGETPLHKAARGMKSDVLSCLLDLGADLNAVNYNHDSVWTVLGVETQMHSFGFERVSDVTNSVPWQKCQLILQRHATNIKKVNESFEDEELSRMKAKLISNSNISYLDFVSATSKQCEVILRNTIVREALSLGSYQQEFKEFATLISSRYHKGIRRLALLDNIHAKSNSLFHGLTSDCVEHILSFLPEEDLLCLSKTCNSL